MENKDSVCGIGISNGERVIFSRGKEKIRKIDIVNYYKKISRRMLPLISQRPASVIRCHGGVDKNSCFFKKHFDNDFSTLAKIKGNDFFSLDSQKALISEAQLGTIEIHIWGAKIEKINKPDLMVFDLDPDENLSTKILTNGVLKLKKILDSLKLKSFLKTSGGKGYHIFVPIKKEMSWSSFSKLSNDIALLCERQYPKLFTTTIKKAERKGKIFIDYLRNKKGATTVAPYSVRTKNNGAVSMPIKWSELKKYGPHSIDIKKALEMIKKPNPWKDIFK